MCFHKWTKWSDKKLYADTRRGYQEKTCYKCGKIKARYVR